MTEFDFDELDKAVNSLMSPNKKDTDSSVQPEKSDETGASQSNAESPKSNPDAVLAAATRQVNAASKSDAPAPPTVPEIAPEDISSSTDSTEPTEEAQAQPETIEQPGSTDKEQSQQATPPVQASLASKRRGQFMDMKHPSASMKPPSKTDAPISRSGVTIAPPSAPSTSTEPTPAVAPDPVDAEQAPTAPAEDAEPQQTEASSSASEAPTSASEEAAEPAVEQQEQPAAEESRPDTTDDSSNADEGLDSSADDANAPTSPFLPGAKVEKRPLGGAAPTGPADLPELDGDDEVKLEEPSSDIEPAKTQTASALPRELHESVMKVESDTTTADANQPEKAASEAADQTESGRSSSIPQQYESKSGIASDDTTEPASASLYDSPGIPADMPSMPKKKSHLAVVAAIVGLILVGGAVGAVVYLVQTGSL